MAEPLIFDVASDGGHLEPVEVVQGLRALPTAPLMASSMTGFEEPTSH